jgi:Glutamate-cysteine ligase
VDDRTPAERGIADINESSSTTDSSSSSNSGDERMVGRGVSPTPKSRYASISTFIHQCVPGDTRRQRDVRKYNDISCPVSDLADLKLSAHTTAVLTVGAACCTATLCCAVALAEQCAHYTSQTNATASCALTMPIYSDAMAFVVCSGSEFARLTSVTLVLTTTHAYTPTTHTTLLLQVDAASEAQLLAAGVDPALARHIAHLFTRDPLVMFEGRIEQLNDAVEVEHFENIQSTNWQTVRWKPPPPRTKENDAHIGWR